MSLFIYFLSLIAAFLLSPSPHAPNYQCQLIWNNAAQKYLLSLSLAKNRYLFTRPQIFVSKSTNICRALPQNVPQSAVLIDRLLFGFASNPQIVRQMTIWDDRVVRRQWCPPRLHRSFHNLMSWSTLVVRSRSNRFRPSLLSHRQKQMFSSFIGITFTI